MNCRNIYRSAKLKRLATVFAFTVAGLGLASCDDVGGDPTKQIGADPVLPALQQYLLPPIRIARPVSWGMTPRRCRRDCRSMRSPPDFSIRDRSTSFRTAMYW